MRKFLILAVLAFAAQTQLAAADGPMDPHTVVVLGSAEETVQPDFATISLRVISTDRSSQAAQQANSALMAKVVAAIRAEGITEADIGTSEFTITVLHPRHQSGDDAGQDETVTSSYSVTNLVTVRLTDLAKIGKISDVATRAGADMNDGVMFGVLDEQALYGRLLAAAVRNARRQAEIMAGTEHTSVGRLIAVTNLPPRDHSWSEPLRAEFVPPGYVSITRAVNMTGAVTVSARVLAVYTLE
jgi:uncharacterized protein